MSVVLVVQLHQDAVHHVGAIHAADDEIQHAEPDVELPRPAHLHLRVLDSREAVGFGPRERNLVSVRHRQRDGIILVSGQADGAAERHQQLRWWRERRRRARWTDHVAVAARAGGETGRDEGWNEPGVTHREFLG